MRITTATLMFGTSPNKKWTRSSLLPRAATMMVPTATEMRKNDAKDASSLSSVVRATRPAAKRDQQPGDQAAEAHGIDVEAGDQEPDRCARQDGVRERVAHQAHAPQHEKHAERAGAERQRNNADQRAAHVIGVRERRDQKMIEKS